MTKPMSRLLSSSSVESSFIILSRILPEATTVVGLMPSEISSQLSSGTLELRVLCGSNPLLYLIAAGQSSDKEYSSIASSSSTDEGEKSLMPLGSVIK